MDEKKADDKLYQTKKKIDNVDEHIESNQEKLKGLDDLEETFSSLHNNMMTCAMLLSQSMKSKRTTAIVNNIEETNQVEYRKTISSIDDERRTTKENIKKLNDEKESLNKELKQLYDNQNQKNEEERKKENLEEEKDKMGSEGENAHNSN